MSRAIPSTFAIPTHAVCFRCSGYTDENYTWHNVRYCGRCFDHMQKLLKAQK